MTPSTSIDVRSPSMGVAITTADVARFLASTALAAAWLRWRSLEAIARSVELRQHKCSNRVTNRAELARSIAIFDRLRPLVFTSRDKCLFDSLALTMYLAGRGIAVRWVIGVSTRPFLAHSWVQDEAEVLNDLHERVRRFTPLLVV